MNIKLHYLIPYTFTILFASLFMASCNIGSLEEPTQIIDIENELTLELVQDLEEANKFTWIISTVREDLCNESELITNYEVTGTEAELMILGLETPNDCTNFEAQIQSFEPFTFLTDEKIVDINIANKTVNRAVLFRTPSFINIISENSADYIIRETKIFTVEKTHFWGGLLNPTDSNKALFFDLYQQLTESIVYEQIEQGNFGYFSYSESNLRVMDSQSYDQSEIGFAVKISDLHELDRTLVEQLILDFRLQHPEVDFFINLGDGSQF